MAAQFLYPTNAELTEIQRDLLPQLMLTDPIFRFFPIVDHEVDQLIWDQRDNYRGMQNIRGINGDPVKIFREGAKRYNMLPGYYGEFDDVDEMKMTRMAQLGTFAHKPVDITTLVRECQDRLLNREINRIKFMLWTLLTTGAFSVSDARGQVQYTGSFPLQTATVSVAWSSTATAKPVSDLRAIQLLSRFKSVNFGRNATIFLNRKMMNLVLGNTNANDIGRPINNAPIIDLAAVNRIMVSQDLPQFEIYDDGYIDEAGTGQLWLPDDVAILVGARDNNDPLGEYVKTINANREDVSAGSYTWVVDSAKTGNPVPRKITVHQGHNGGPTCWYPGAIVIIDLVP